MFDFIVRANNTASLSIPTSYANQTLAWLTGRNQGAKVLKIRRTPSFVEVIFLGTQRLYDAIANRVAELIERERLLDALQDSEGYQAGLRGDVVIPIPHPETVICGSTPSPTPSKPIRVVYSEKRGEWQTVLVELVEGAEWPTDDELWRMVDPNWFSSGKKITSTSPTTKTVELFTPQ